MNEPIPAERSPSRPAAGLAIDRQAKIGLIRKFQRIEGNYDCCASAYNRVCMQFECLWRDECLSMTAE